MSATISEERVYDLRKTTIQSSLSSQSSHSHGSGHRQILPLNATPSISSGDHRSNLFDPETCSAKVDHRIQTFYVNRVISSCMGRLSRERTALQGASASFDYAAAHASLEPSTTDTFTQQIYQRIIEVGMTPTKTTPFLKARCGIGSPEIAKLAQNHSDENYVFQFLIKKLPRRGLSSSYAGTRYEWNCNATFSNPKESNQFDSLLERTIRSFREEIQTQSEQGALSPEEATSSLVRWLLNYYDQTIYNLIKRISHLETYQDLNDKLRIVETAIYSKQDVPDEILKQYLDDVDRFISCAKLLFRNEQGCPSCLVHLRLSRNDYRFLNTLVQHNAKGTPLDQIRPILEQNARRTSSLKPIAAVPLIEKHQRFLSEAKVQRETTAHYGESCAMTKLRDIFFPEAKEGKLQEAVFAICKPRTPVQKVRTKRFTCETTTTSYEKWEQRRESRSPKSFSPSSILPDSPSLRSLTPPGPTKYRTREITPIPFCLDGESSSPSQLSWERAHHSFATDKDSCSAKPGPNIACKEEPNVLLDDEFTLGISDQHDPFLDEPYKFTLTD